MTATDVDIPPRAPAAHQRPGGWPRWRLSAMTRGAAATPRRVFVVTFVLAFLVMAIWSLATPLFASPDEWAHVARAVALDRGQVIGQTVESSDNAFTDINIPELYAVGEKWERCFAGKPTVPASCAGPFKGSARVVPATTYAGRYPPLYYAIVGLPSLVTVSPTGLYLMRMVSGLLSALFLALAVMSIVAWSKRRFLLIGLVLAVTPMVVFLGGVVNPSGLEIMTAVCLWTSGLVLVLERAKSPPAGLVAVVAGSAATLMLVRALSPLWAAIIAVVLVLLGGWRVVVSISRARSARWSLVVLVPCAIFALLWTVLAHALDLLPLGLPVTKGGSRLDLVVQIFGYTDRWLQQMVGVFGSLDAVSPLLTYVLWGAALGLVVLLALACPRARHIAALLLVVVLVLVVPIVIASSQAHRLGIVWQGRYTMPMAVGIPLVASVLAERSDAVRSLVPRLSSILCMAVGVAAFAAFVWALRRYMVGATGPLDFFDGAWHPPLGAITLTVASGVVTILWLGFVRYLVTAGGSPKEVGRGAPSCR